MTEKIQHRGLSKVEGQNSANSFEGFSTRFGKSIECDIFLLSDGNVAVVHNKDLALSQEEVERMTLADLQIAMEEHNNSNGIETTESIPLFEEVFLGAIDRENGLNLEIKASSPEMAVILARQIVERISIMSESDETFKNNLQSLEKMSLCSFSIEALAAAKEEMEKRSIQIPRTLSWVTEPKHANDMKISATALDFAEKIPGDNWTIKGVEIANSVGVESIGLDWKVITKELVDDIHSRGMQVVAWVVNGPEKIVELEEIGVDKVITED